MPIKSSSDFQSRRLKILFWGGWATRKTETILRYFPNVLIFDTEGNTDQLFKHPDIPPFLVNQTKDVYEILSDLDNVAAGKLTMPNGQPIYTVALDTVSILWQVRQEVGAINAEKRVARYNKTADEATMTQLDWVVAKRPLKRLMTRLANMPIPFLILTAREKDQYKDVQKGDKTEQVKVGQEPDAAKGLLYDVNLSMRFQNDEQGWFAQVDKVQGVLSQSLPLNGILREFPAQFLRDYVSKVIQPGDMKDDSEVAQENFDKENKDSYPRTAAGLVTWAMETFNLDGNGVGSALKAKGIAAFDPSNWETMMQAVEEYAKVQGNGVQN